MIPIISSENKQIKYLMCGIMMERNLVSIIKRKFHGTLCTYTTTNLNEHHSMEHNTHEINSICSHWMNTLNFDSTKLFPVPEFPSTPNWYPYTHAVPDTKIKLRRYLVIYNLCILFVKLYYIRCCPGIMAPSIVFYAKLINSL